ncbi:MAG: rRNA pseudouridine synthase [Verrucomicrobiota bacterium]|nr:rRNA pseudouridine synthase [Verrucomicrobiota bacterium]
MQRLDQLLASLGYGSRRETRALIESGHVTVLGQPAGSIGEKVSPAEVRVDGAPLDHPDGLLLLLHKPAGLVCSHDQREGIRVYDLLPPRWLRRNPPITSIGRLDKGTSGLLLLTDQHALVHQLTSPRQKIPKTYLATLDRDVPATDAAAIAALFAKGRLLLPGESKPCAPAELKWRGARLAELTITEGRYHQVRRMFASQGCEVAALHCTRLGQLELGGLPVGEWRELPLDFFEENHEK